MFGLYRVCAKIPPLGKSYFKIASASIHFFPSRFFGVSVVVVVAVVVGVVAVVVVAVVVAVVVRLVGR